MSQEELNRAGIAAWYAIALEHDKLLFKLSAASIALVVYLIAHDNQILPVESRLYLSGLGCFLITLLSMSVIFSQNRLMIEHKLAGQEYAGKLLNFLDIMAVVAFGSGCICVVANSVIALL